MLKQSRSSYASDSWLRFFAHSHLALSGFSSKTPYNSALYLWHIFCLNHGVLWLNLELLHPLEGKEANCRYDLTSFEERETRVDVTRSNGEPRRASDRI